MPSKKISCLNILPFNMFNAKVFFENFQIQKDY